MKLEQIQKAIGREPKYCLLKGDVHRILSEQYVVHKAVIKMSLSAGSCQLILALGPESNRGPTAEDTEWSIGSPVFICVP